MTNHVQKHIQDLIRVDITPPPVQQQSSVVQEPPAFAAYKPADNTKPAPGTILGRDLSPAEKEKALSRAKLQEFAAELTSNNVPYASNIIALAFFIN